MTTPVNDPASEQELQDEELATAKRTLLALESLLAQTQEAIANTRKQIERIQATRGRNRPS
jgi:hypothetical protein